MITPAELGGDEDTARRVLVRARGIAPCIDTLDGEPKKDAIAILKGVLAEIPAAGARRAKTLARNGTSITYEDVASAFTTDDVTSLRLLCDAATTAGLPIGCFPEDRLFERLWPGERYP